MMNDFKMLVLVFFVITLGVTLSIVTFSIVVSNNYSWVVKCYNGKEINRIEKVMFLNYYSTEQSAIKTAEEYRKIPDCVCVVYED